MKTLRPKLSVITQYPDALTFMHGNERRWCGDGSQRFAGLLTDLTAVESNAIAGVLWEPLNAAIREYFDTAEEGRNTRWAVARMDYDGQRGRGICTRGWFMSYFDSMKKQGILPALGYEHQRAPGGFTSGVAHPNFFGYLAQRRAIIEAIDAAAKR